MNNSLKIRSALAQSEFDALLLTDPISCRYATGFNFTDGAVVITAYDMFLITDSRYEEAAAESVPNAHICLFSMKKRLADWLNEIIRTSGAKTIGAESKRMSHASWQHWSETLPVPLVPADGILEKLRACKSQEELDMLIAAQRIAEKALDEVLGLIVPGVTEREIEAALVASMLRAGADGVSFDPIVVTGKKTSMPHGVPGDVKVAYGDFVTMDFGCIKDGWCSDMTRTVAVGSADSEMRNIYSVVLEAQLAGIAAARPGVPGCDIHNAAAKVIEDAGYGEYFGHGFGHGLGLEIHETPSASPGWTTSLPEGSVISAEPGIYLPGKYGVRIEDVLFLTGNEAVNITKAPKNLIIL